MRRRRARGSSRGLASFSTLELCRGPGNLTRALGITLRDDGRDLTESQLRIEARDLPARELTWSRRIGINVGVDSEWRVFAAASLAVSGPSRTPLTRQRKHSRLS